MTGDVAKFIDVLDRIAPAQLAAAWDNVGLQLGSRNWPVKKIWTALDPLPEVVAQACENDVDLLITHHPLFFKPINNIDCETPLGRIVQMALSCQLAVYSTHTNLDSVHGGVNDVLAKRIGLDHLRVLSEPESRQTQRGNDESMAFDVSPLARDDQLAGLGRVGELSSSLSLRDFAEKMKTVLNIGAVKVVGDLDEMVKTVAVCSGSGSSLLSAAIGSGAQAYVSGDLGYHTARDAQQAGIGLIDVGHYGSERLIVDVLAASIRDASKVLGLDVTVEAARIETDPFHHL